MFSKLQDRHTAVAVGSLPSEFAVAGIAVDKILAVAVLAGVRIALVNI